MQAAINRLLAAEAEQEKNRLEWYFEWALERQPGAPVASLRALVRALSAESLQLQHFCSDCEGGPYFRECRKRLSIPTAAWAHYCAVEVS